MTEGGKFIILEPAVARVVKLVDALDLGSSPREWLGVRLPPLAPLTLTKTYKEVHLARTPTGFTGFLLSNEVRRIPGSYTRPNEDNNE